MQIWGVPEGELHEIAGALGIEFQGGQDAARITRASGVLRPVSTPTNPYQRVSTQSWDGKPPRRVFAVCWHGHRDFMAEIFDRYPDARVKSGWADYRGADAFYSEHEDSAWRNIGSAYSPCMACEACSCPYSGGIGERRGPGGEIVHAHRVTFGTLEPAGNTAVLTNVRTIRQAEVRACPHVIFSPEHYRDDGSCKCDDSGESIMAEWGYSWDADARRWQ